MESFKTWVLLENRIEWLKSNVGDIDTSHDALAQHRDPHAIIDHFAAHDPHPKKAYTQWVIGRYKNADFRQEDAPRVGEALRNFDRYKGRLEKKDINRYGSLSDLEDAVEPHLGQAPSNKQAKTIAKHEGADLVHDQDGITVHHLKTHEAAKLYGKGTKWCTTSDNCSTFNHYNKMGNLYRVQTPDKKLYQFHFETSQYANDKDKQQNLFDLIEKYPGLKNVKEFHGKAAEVAKMNPRTVRGKTYGSSKTVYDYEIHDPFTGEKYFKVDPGIGSNNKYIMKWHPDILQKHPELEKSHEFGDMTLMTKVHSANLDNLRINANDILAKARKNGFKDQFPSKTQDKITTFHDPETGEMIIKRDSSSYPEKITYSGEYLRKNGIDPEIIKQGPKDPYDLTRYIHSNKGKSFNLVGTSSISRGVHHVFKGDPGKTDAELSAIHEAHVRDKHGSEPDFQIHRHGPTAFTATMHRSEYSSGPSHLTSVAAGGNVISHEVNINHYEKKPNTTNI